MVKGSQLALFRDFKLSQLWNCYLILFSIAPLRGLSWARGQQLNLYRPVIQLQCWNAGSWTGATSGSMEVSVSTRATADGSWSIASTSRGHAWTSAVVWNVEVRTSRFALKRLTFKHGNEQKKRCEPCSDPGQKVTNAIPELNEGLSWRRCVK